MADLDGAKNELQVAEATLGEAREQATKSREALQAAALAAQADYTTRSAGDVSPSLITSSARLPRARWAIMPSTYVSPGNT